MFHIKTTSWQPCSNGFHKLPPVSLGSQQPWIPEKMKPPPGSLRALDPRKSRRLAASQPRIPEKNKANTWQPQSLGSQEKPPRGSLAALDPRKSRYLAVLQPWIPGKDAAWQLRSLGSQENSLSGSLCSLGFKEKPLSVSFAALGSRKSCRLAAPALDPRKSRRLAALQPSLFEKSSLLTGRKFRKLSLTGL